MRKYWFKTNEAVSIKIWGWQAKLSKQFLKLEPKRQNC